MPNYEKTDQTRIIRPRDMEQLYDNARSIRDRTWITILYLTGARPAEVLQLTKKDIIIGPEKTSFHLQTMKLESKETKKFYTHHRNLVLRIPQDHRYIKILEKYLSRLKGPDSQLFRFCVKTGYNIVAETAMAALGESLCPYNFRHSMLTIMAENGASEEELKRVKGSFTTASVRPYLHVRKVEYTIEI